MTLGLKLYYLRSRVKRITQTQMAKDLRIRQATISNIEQGISQPSLPLLRSLCRYFDVTPTYLLDDDGPLVTGPADRWSNRNGLISSGHYVEAPEAALHKLTDQSYLVAMLPGMPIYDDEAAKARAQGSNQDLMEAYRTELARRKAETQELRRELEAERHASRMRRRGKPTLVSDQQPTSAPEPAVEP